MQWEQRWQEECLGPSWPCQRRREADFAYQTTARWRPYVAGDMERRMAATRREHAERCDVRVPVMIAATASEIDWLVYVVRRNEVPGAQRWATKVRDERRRPSLIRVLYCREEKRERGQEQRRWRWRSRAKRESEHDETRESAVCA